MRAHIGQSGVIYQLNATRIMIFECKYLIKPKLVRIYLEKLVPQLRCHIHHLNQRVQVARGAPFETTKL